MLLTDSFLKKKYFWLCWVFVTMQASLQLQRAGATLLCSVRTSHGCDISCCGRAWALQGTGASVVAAVGSVVVVLGLQSTGSTAVVHGLSCSKACGIFWDQGLNLRLLHWQADSLPVSHQRSPQIPFLQIAISYPLLIFDWVVFSLSIWRHSL